MPSITLNGPVVPDDTHNVVLRRALLHSPIALASNTTNYHVIEIGVREGAYTSWVGTWDQSTQKVDAAAPTSILDTGRGDMRLKASQTVVVRITTYGVPATLEGSRVNFTLALVGGRDGPAKPLVAGGASVAEMNSRVAIAALERQINTGGLSEWDEPVQLQDPVALAPTGTFQGRLQRDSATRISIQRYCGNWIEVDGNAVSIGSAGLICDTTDGILSDVGQVTSTAVTTSTLYYVYVGTDGDVRLSTTAPTLNRGVYYFGGSHASARWRFVGWVRLNGSGEYVDTTTDRLVVNYYNREWKSIVLNPGYVDDNALTTFTEVSVTWVPANGGVGVTASYIANGEDGIHVSAFSKCNNSGAGTTRIGIGDNSNVSAAVMASKPSTVTSTIGCTYATVPATGYRTLVLLTSVSAGTGTYGADDGRNGSAADEVATALYTTVPV